MVEKEVRDESEIVMRNIVKQKENKIAFFLRALGGLIIVVGVIHGLSNQDFIMTISALISGVVLMGLGEIVRLLHEINERQKLQ